MKRIIITMSVGWSVVGIVNCPLSESSSTARQRAIIAAIAAKYGSTGVQVQECQPGRETVLVGKGASCQRLSL